MIPVSYLSTPIPVSSLGKWNFWRLDKLRIHVFLWCGKRIFVRFSRTSLFCLLLYHGSITEYWVLLSCWFLKTKVLDLTSKSCQIISKFATWLQIMIFGDIKKINLEIRFFSHFSGFPNFWRYFRFDKKKSVNSAFLTLF